MYHQPQLIYTLFKFLDLSQLHLALTTILLKFFLKYFLLLMCDVDHEASQLEVVLLYPHQLMYRLLLVVQDRLPDDVLVALKAFYF
jgi:hypothetical protein